MSTRPIVLSLCLAFSACLTEEELAEVDRAYGEPQARPFDLQDAIPVVEPELAGPGDAWALEGEAYVEAGEDFEGEVEPPVESPVPWTVSDSALRAYLVWQRHLDDELELARIARTASEFPDLPAELRASTKRFEVPESAEQSFSRFGLSRDEVQQIESLIDATAMSLGIDPLPPPEQLAHLARDTGSTAREFLGWLRLERERLVRERLDAMRPVYGDANVDLVLRHYAVLPSSPHRLGSRYALDGEPEPVN